MGSGWSSGKGSSMKRFIPCIKQEEEAERKVFRPKAAAAARGFRERLLNKLRKIARAEKIEKSSNVNKAALELSFLYPEQLRGPKINKKSN